MNVSQEDLRRAASNAGLLPEQTDELLRQLQSNSTQGDKPKFDVANVAYYLGALIVIGAMGWFMNKAWEGLGGAGLFAVSCVYAVCFVLGGRTLWKQANFRIPSGLLFTMAVCMTPLAVYGLERWTGYWPDTDPGEFQKFHPYINGSWVLMELTTVATGAIALWFWRFPFLTTPIAYALWFMSMDLVALFGRNNDVSWEDRQIISAIFGAVMLFGAYLVDLRGKADNYVFWVYLFGLMAFWGGLTSMDSDSELGKFIDCLINLGLIGCSLILRRRTFIIFGGLGLFGYLTHLAYDVFADSILFPFVLSLIGISIIYLGVKYSRNRDRIEIAIRAVLLPHIRGLIPARAFTE